MAIKENLSSVKVIGVQSESATSAFKSLKEGRLIESPPSPTIADAIAIGRVGERCIEVMKRYVDDMLLVDENDMAYAVVLYLERKKLVVEGAGAATLAALIKYREMFKGKRTVAVVSGGNIDMSLVDRIIRKGLITAGRVGNIDMPLNDVSGSLNKVTEIIARLGANIINIKYDRLSKGLSLGKVKVSFTLEVKNSNHLDEIIQKLKKSGIQVCV
jgi:threonine dehydratase